MNPRGSRGFVESAVFCWLPVVRHKSGQPKVQKCETINWQLEITSFKSVEKKGSSLRCAHLTPRDAPSARGTASKGASFEQSPAVHTGPFISVLPPNDVCKETKLTLDGDMEMFPPSGKHFVFYQGLSYTQLVQ